MLRISPRYGQVYIMDYSVNALFSIPLNNDGTCDPKEIVQVEMAAFTADEFSDFEAHIASIFPIALECVEEYCVATPKPPIATIRGFKYWLTDFGGEPMLQGCPAESERGEEDFDVSVHAMDSFMEAAGLADAVGRALDISPFIIFKSIRG